MSERRANAGFTLIEVVVAIVIVAAVGATLLAVSGSNSEQSARAMLRAQAANIADSYLREILSKAFTDPGVNGETLRANFDDVSDYNNLVDVGARDLNGNPIAQLDRFTVSVLVVANVGFGGLPATQAKRIEVRVTDPEGSTYSINAFKTNHL